MASQDSAGPPAAAASSAAATARQLRDALQAMQLLRPFAPRLAGALASGSADPRLPIMLHVRAGHADDVQRLLDEHGIPVRMRATRMYPPRAAAEPLPGVSFLAGDQEFIIWIFTEAQFRQRLPIGDESTPSARLNAAATLQLLERAQATAGSQTNPRAL